MKITVCKVLILIAILMHCELCIYCKETLAAGGLTDAQKIEIRDKRGKARDKKREELNKEGPKVRFLTNKKYEKRKEPINIEIYYKCPIGSYSAWYGFTSYKGNERLFKIGEESKITKNLEVIKTAEISIPKAEINDIEAKNEMCKIASNLGGDALIEVYRSPIPGEIHEDNYGGSIFGMPILPSYGTYRRDVLGFIYKAKVVCYGKELSSIYGKFTKKGQSSKYKNGYINRRSK